jgi:protocatechuate 3,4-dioxygenase beta subunit
MIAGRVLDDEGDPVPRAIVQLMRNAYPNGRRQLLPHSQTQADEDGEYKLSNVMPGRYLLATVPPRVGYYEPVHKNDRRSDPAKPEEDLVTTYFPGTTDAASATAIEVVAGRDVRGTDLQLRRSQVFRIRGKLSGNINPEAGKTLRISIVDRDSFIMDVFGSPTANIEKDGSFDLRGVSPGQYRLMVTTVSGMIRTLARQNIDVGGHNIDGITVVLHPTGSIRGSIQWARTVATASEKPTPVLSNMMLRLEPAAGQTSGVPFGQVKPDGSFVFDDVAADRYRLFINSLPDGVFVKSSRLGDQDALGHDLDLSGGVGAAPMDIVLSATAGQIDGTVQTDHQMPAAGTQVSLIPDPADPTRTDLFTGTVTDQNGQFSLKSLAPGKYRLYAWEEIENGIQYDPEFMKPLVELGTKITVEENGHLTQALTWISVAQMEQARAK